MYSMKRTSTPLLRPNVARSTTSSSLIPRCTTTLIFTGENPVAIAASIPSSTCSSSSRRVISRKRCFFNVSRLMLMRRSPESCRSCAIKRNVAPLVVTAKSIGFPARGEFAVAGTCNAESLLMRTGKCARIVGSPPVRRMPSTSKCETQMLATRCSSSYVRTSSRGSHFIPSAGMQ